MFRSVFVIALTLLLLIFGFFFQPTNKDQFVKLPDSPVSGSHKALLLKDGRVLLFGYYSRNGVGDGYIPHNLPQNVPNSPNALREGERLAVTYDPQSKVFFKVNAGSQLNTGHFGVSPVLLDDGKVLLFGDSDVEIYDPKLNTTKIFGGRLPHSYTLPKATRISDKEIIVFSDPFDGRQLGKTQMFVYDLNTKKFNRVKGQERLPDSEINAKLLQNGLVLISGWGHQGSKWAIYKPKERAVYTKPFPKDTPYAPIELLQNGKVLMESLLYDPANDSFIKVGAMNYKNHETATRLQDGRILFTGGYDEHALSWCDYHDKSEIFDPKTNQFSKSAVLNAARYQHTATLLKDGSVLIVGGRDLSSCDSGEPLESETDSVEVFVPFATSK